MTFSDEELLRMKELNAGDEAGDRLSPLTFASWLSKGRCDALIARLEAAETMLHTPDVTEDYERAYCAWRKAAGK